MSRVAPRDNPALIALLEVAREQADREAREARVDRCVVASVLVTYLLTCLARLW